MFDPSRLSFILDDEDFVVLRAKDAREREREVSILESKIDDYREHIAAMKIVVELAEDAKKDAGRLVELLRQHDPEAAARFDEAGYVDTKCKHCDDGTGDPVFLCECCLEALEGNGDRVKKIQHLSSELRKVRGRLKERSK